MIKFLWLDNSKGVAHSFLHRCNIDIFNWSAFSDNVPLIVSGVPFLIN